MANTPRCKGYECHPPVARAARPVVWASGSSPSPAEMQGIYGQNGDVPWKNALNILYKCGCEPLDGGWNKATWYFLLGLQRKNNSYNWRCKWKKSTLRWDCFEVAKLDLAQKKWLWWNQWRMDTFMWLFVSTFGISPMDICWYLLIQSVPICGLERVRGIVRKWVFFPQWIAMSMGKMVIFWTDRATKNVLRTYCVLEHRNGDRAGIVIPWWKWKPETTKQWCYRV